MSVNNSVKNYVWFPILVMGGCFDPAPEWPESSTSDGSSSTGDATTGAGEATVADEGTTTSVETEGTGVDDSGTNCGNGVVQAGETCDDRGESATCDADCTEVVCGDLSVNAAAGEECEGDDLAGGTCQGLGFDLGMLSCGGECLYDTTGCALIPAAPLLDLSFSQIKQFDFSWAAVDGAEYYRLLETPAMGKMEAVIAEHLVGESVSFEMPLHFRYEASYVLQACNSIDVCTDSASVDVMDSLDSLTEAVGYFKASNAGVSDLFGYSIALSSDGNTLAVGAYNEDSNSAGINGDQADDALVDSGAVYVFVRDGMGGWLQQAYVKASNPGANDAFGISVALSSDGSTLAVGAQYEDSATMGVDGDQADNNAFGSGAAYVFVRSGMEEWSQQAYIKASNTDALDYFGIVTLSADGDTLVVTSSEDSNAAGIGGDQGDNSANASGAAYVFARDGMGVWSQQAYIKAAHVDAGDYFGVGVALSGDGNTLAVGAPQEDCSATGIDSNLDNNLAGGAGSVYVFVRGAMGVWSQQAYVKASNTDSADTFGYSVALSSDGSVLAVGARYEDSDTTGVDGDQADNTAVDSGAAYVFVRDGMGVWSQQAYVKASNAEMGDYFGWSIALSGDGNTLAVGARVEDSNATGVGGEQAGNTAIDSGAVYLFERDGMGGWSQQAYVKASNAGAGDYFGWSVALSGDGDTLTVGAYVEGGSATGVGGNQFDDTASYAGAVYLY